MFYLYENFIQLSIINIIKNNLLTYSVGSSFYS